MLDFFSEALDWPIDADDLEDATFEYTPEELGVDGSRVKDLTSLRQLRPLVQGQPWGIFFLEFAGDRLPVVQLRRLLQRLVERKRRSARDQKTWALNDLLFIVLTGAGASVELHLVAFSDEGGGVPTIRTLEWRPGDTPKRRLTRLSEELLPRLEWPSDVSARDNWTTQWQGAFRLRHGETIRDAKRLAEQMASVALDMRHEIEAALANEGGVGPLSELLADYRQQLSGTATPSSFADTAAQTLVYGLLTNRIADPEGFGASPTLAAVPLANPFLAEFFDRVLTHVEASAAAEDSLEQLVADLRATNVEAVLDEFGGTLHGGDPVIHLYEHFLGSYDNTQKADSGAFYTPTPIVRFIVRAIDRVLETSFQLPDGLLSADTWADVGRRNGFAVPDGIDPNTPFITVVDPAVGTGTFLVEWIHTARERLVRGDTSDDWAKVLEERVLPRLHGFELNPSAYAIAHVKLALECHDVGAELPEDLLVLTSTLEHPAPQASLLPSEDLVARQGAIADALKRDAAFTVAIGNPPYDREQRGATSSGPRKGGIVRHGAPGQDPLLEPILDELKAGGDGVHAKNLFNDYIYFIRWATWRMLEFRPSPGVVSFITASSYLDGRSFGSIRAYLRRVFDELWIIDLGGDNRGAHQEENVFDIQTPVAIFVGVKHQAEQSDECTVRFRRVHGSRQEKLAELDATGLDSALFDDVAGQGFDLLTPAGEGHYFDWPTLDAVFPTAWTGCKASRTWPISPFPDALEKRWLALTSADGGQRGALLRETRDRKATSVVSPMLTPGPAKLTPIGDLATGEPHEGLRPYAFRSFDRQWLLADHRVLDVRGANLWASQGPDQVFLTTLSSTRVGQGPVLVATPYVPDLHHFRGSFGGRDVFPLWPEPEHTRTNCPNAMLDALSSTLGVTVTGESVFAYVYGLLGTGAFSQDFAEELTHGTGYAHVPLSASRDLFQRAVDLGAELMFLHTWGIVDWGGQTAAPPATRVLAHPSTTPSSFAFDAETGEIAFGDGRVGPVSEQAWAFEVSGLKVLQAWLSQRMENPGGKKSSDLDLIGPDNWNESEELCRVVDMVQGTLDRTPRALALLGEITEGEVLTASQVGIP